MNEIVTLAHSQGFFAELFPIVAIACGIGALAIVMGTVNAISKNNEGEKTKREISAYVAEGSITPDEGERLIKASKHENRSCG